MQFEILRMNAELIFLPQLYCLYSIISIFKNEVM